MDINSSNETGTQRRHTGLVVCGVVNDVEVVVIVVATLGISTGTWSEGSITTERVAHREGSDTGLGSRLSLNSEYKGVNEGDAPEI